MPGRGGPRERIRQGTTLIAAGGLSMTLLFVPFTLTHGPTSFNQQGEILGLDMHRWGMLLGTVPPVLIATGLLRLRSCLALGERVVRWAGATIVAALLFSAAMDLAFRALGPPFLLFLVAPAGAVAVAALTPRTVAARRVRRALGGLTALWWAALALALVPQQTSDSFDGYRLFGLVSYAAVGIGWWLLARALRGDAAVTAAP